MNSPFGAAPAVLPKLDEKAAPPAVKCSNDVFGSAAKIRSRQERNVHVTHHERVWSNQNNQLSIFDGDLDVEGLLEHLRLFQDRPLLQQKVAFSLEPDNKARLLVFNLEFRHL